MTDTLDLTLWQFIRAAGLLAFAMLSASVFLGIALKSRLMEGLAKRPWVLEAHQSLSLASLGLTCLHLGLLLANRHVSFDLVAALVPFASDWKPLPVALGIGGFYLIALLTLSSYLQKLFGYRLWRALHFSSFLAWLAALAHGITAGSDSGLTAVQAMYWASAGAVLFATVYRALLPSPPRADRAAAARSVVVSGREAAAR